MGKTKQTKQAHVVMFVEGDTDELFFKALLEHYRRHSNGPMLPCSVCNLKGVTRYTSKLLAKLKNEYLPDARKKDVRIQTICCSYDTDVFEAKNPLIVDWKSLEKSIKRLGVDTLVRIGVKSSIEDWILDDTDGICSFLKLKAVPRSLKGNDGFLKLSDLYATAKRTYQKGYAICELISALDMDKIIQKRKDVLQELEAALGIVPFTNK